jgi:hypothetical protein
LSARLLGYSFHSVKGGVGKSTLSALAAVHIARRRPGTPVYLVDMDLTGTSLADVLPLEAPRWDGDEIDLLSPPSTFFSRKESRERMEARQEQLQDWLEKGESPDRGTAIEVPFLNDFLLFATPNWDERKDVHPRAITWRMQGGPENLFVIPSSALPADLQRTLPVIFDEERAAFLEGRLEHLLAALLRVHKGEGEVAVVFDTPPTIPGMSKSVLSLALRLGRSPKITLADDGYVPPPLDEAQIHWSAFLVATTDLQDLRAAGRWFGLVKVEEEAILKPLLNRAKKGDGLERRELLDQALLEIGPTVLRDPLFVEEDLSLQFFREERLPPELEGLMAFIENSW